MVAMAAQRKARPHGTAPKDREFEELLRSAAALIQHRQKPDPLKVASKKRATAA